MDWISLKKSLSSKPLVLAGPILRQVTSKQVTVWLAMRVPAVVTLTVVDDHGKLVMEGERNTVAIGLNLHIVAVTAQLVPAEPELQEGIVYQYDLAFELAKQSMNLDVASGKAKLAYGSLKKPSFALPPSDLNRLRLLQGSCRMPHAPGQDMLPLVDDLIEKTATDAFARPHQLLLTGDQIYADDVSDSLLTMLIDAAHTLLGWEETIPPSFPGPMFVTPIPAGLRGMVLGFPDMGNLGGNAAGFSSVDLQSHLMSLGEYLAMYLFVWSDVLWPTILPSFDDVAGEVYTRIPKDEVWAFKPIVNLDQVRMEIHTERVAEFKEKLWAVRRVLANIPTYMIFDDHEVTDDWNMTRQFCQDVYGSKLGLRIVQNALVAYSLCQHWGNVPEDFFPPGSGQAPRPGASLLSLLDTPQPTADNAFQQKAAEYDRRSPEIRKLVAVHDAAAIRARQDHAVFHDSHALRFHYTVEGLGHQIIFTDTRTSRAFPKNADGTHLLSKTLQTDQYKEQILDTPDTGTRLLFVVLSTNMPPVPPIRAATRHAWTSNQIKHYPDIYEAWELPSESFDRLLVALTSKLPLDPSEQKIERHIGPVIVLSGDVHMSFASRLMYRATKRYDDDAQPRGATAVIAQLVCSGFKRQDEDTIRFNRVGYYAAPYPWVTQKMIRHTLTEGYVGWSFSDGSKQKVGRYPIGGSIFVRKGTLDISPGETVIDSYDPSLLVLTQAPHYRYRLDYLLPTKQFLPTSPPTMGPLPAGASPETRKAVAEAYALAVQEFLTHNQVNPPKVVGCNNFGEIRLDWGVAESRKVHFTVRWRIPGDATTKITTYSVRLDLNKPDDTEFPDIKARVEP